MTDKITLIIPLRLTAGTHEGEARLARLCATVPRDLFNILISDYGTEERFAGPIRAMADAGVEVVRHPSPGRLFSIGHARDFGAQMAKQPVLLFNDIDFYGTADMYRAIHAEVLRRDLATNRFDYFCVPVLFLTEAGTRDWFERAAAGRALVEPLDLDGLDAAGEQVQFTAFGSSAIVVNRHHYLSLGGHDPRFTGHGAEDYDLLHRLVSLAPRGPRPNDYFTDYKDNGVRHYWGFRPWYALSGLEVFERSLHLVHLWHPRRTEKGYFRPRANFRFLRRVMRGFDRGGRMPLPLADLTRNGKWLVFYRSARDLMLLRQLLPFAARYRLVRKRALPSGYSLSRTRDIADDDLILIAPDVLGDRVDLAAEASLADLRILSIEATARMGAYTASLLAAGQGRQPLATVSATALPIRLRPGRPVFFSWDRLKLDGLLDLGTGAIPPPKPLHASIFASFGGPDLLDRASHPRPQKKRKSSLWVRIKRRLTGY